MITIGLAGVIVVGVLMLFFLVSARFSTMEAAFVQVSWVPLAALLLEIVFFGRLTSRLSYFAVAIPVLTSIVSLVLTFVGMTLLESARRHREPRPRLLPATLLASVPVVLLAGYVLYAFVVAVL